MNQEPRFRFHQQKELVNLLANITADPRFRQTADLALLQFISERHSGDPQAAMANAHRTEGARDFLQLLFNFAETANARSAITDVNLKGNSN